MTRTHSKAIVEVCGEEGTGPSTLSKIEWPGFCIFHWPSLCFILKRDKNMWSYVAHASCLRKEIEAIAQGIVFWNYMLNRSCALYIGYFCWDQKVMLEFSLDNTQWIYYSKITQRHLQLLCVACGEFVSWLFQGYKLTKILFCVICQWNIKFR